MIATRRSIITVAARTFSAERDRPRHLQPHRKARTICGMRYGLTLLALCCVASTLLADDGPARAVRAADGYTPFDGEKSEWHDGFVRYDFVMDEQTLAI